MYSSADWSVTPRPTYPADGRKIPGIYCQPHDLKHEIEGELGPFPLFHFWGPTADIVSSTWIAACARFVLDKKHPSLTLVYLPHLDYDHQRYGPDDPRSLPGSAAAGPRRPAGLPRGHRARGEHRPPGDGAVVPRAGRCVPSRA